MKIANLIVILFIYSLVNCQYKINNSYPRGDYWERFEFRNDTLINGQKIKFKETLYNDSLCVMTNYYNELDSLIYNTSYDIYNKQFFRGRTNIDSCIISGFNYWIEIDTGVKLINITFWQNFERGDTLCFNITSKNEVSKVFSLYNNPCYKCTFKFSEFYYSEQLNSLILDRPIFVNYISKRKSSRYYLSGVKIRGDYNDFSYKIKRVY